MKRTINYIFLLVLISACKKYNTGPTPADNFLDYTIKEIPVTQDYLVGAFYYNFGGFNAAITEVPVVGKYAMPNGLLTPSGIMSQHITQAAVGGIDYFIFSYRSANKDATNWKNDSTLIQTFRTANTGGMKFALQYNWSNTSYAVSNTAPLEKDATKLGQFFNDITRTAAVMNDANYMKVNGKTLLLIQNAQLLYSNNNVAIYDTLRNRLSALGFTMYIVGMQDRWTPPARYPFRYIGCVDAIYHQSFSTQLSSWDRWYVLPQAMDQNWEYSRQYFADSMHVSYIPNISPAYNWLITNPTSLNPSYPRTDSGAMYRQLCNVAKMNADNSSRMVFIDSWNSWQDDSQLEPATDYQNRYLDITKKEFKK